MMIDDLPFFGALIMMLFICGIMLAQAVFKKNRRSIIGYSGAMVLAFISWIGYCVWWLHFGYTTLASSISTDGVPITLNLYNSNGSAVFLLSTDSDHRLTLANAALTYRDGPTDTRKSKQKLVIARYDSVYETERFPTNLQWPNNHTVALLGGEASGATFGVHPK